MTKTQNPVVSSPTEMKTKMPAPSRTHRRATNGKALSPISMESFDSSTHRRVPHRGSPITPRALAALQSGAKVNVVMGQVGDRFLAIEAAYVNVLKTYSALARDSLCPGVTTLVIDADCKGAVKWVYRYMLAGESDAKFAENEKLDNLPADHLISVHKAASGFDYEALSNVTWNRIREVIHENGCYDLSMADVKTLVRRLPDSIELIAESILRYNAWHVYHENVENFEYQKEIFGDDEIGELVGTAIKNKLALWVARSENYYAGRASFNDSLRRAVHQARMAKTQCYNCGRTGHMARNCTAPRKAMPYEKSSPTSKKMRNTAPAKSGLKAPKLSHMPPVKSSGVGTTATQAPSIAPSKLEGTNPASTVPSTKRSSTPPAASALSYAKVLTTPPPPPVGLASPNSTGATPPVTSATAVTKSTLPAKPKVIGTSTNTSHANGKPSANSSVASPNARRVDTPHMSPTSKAKVPAAGASPQAFNASKLFATTTTKPTGTTHAAPNHTRRPAMICYNCGKPGHIARFCQALDSRAHQFPGRDTKRKVGVPNFSSDNMVPCYSVVLKRAGGQRG